jgi:bifunctional UDP-N-acetylglucosamine pyrophosphorylase/glucosamine-1-phosphate N-acetyltransferase
VAPVSIGAGAIVGAGSVVTKPVAADELAIARGEQRGLAGWAKRFREKQRAKKEQG